MLSTPESIGVVAVVAAVTFFTRSLPFALFRNTEKIPRFVRYLGDFLPFAAMGMLVIYCLKSVSPLAWPYGLPELIAVLAVILLHRWKHNTFLSVGAGTALYMLLIQFVFV